jgi:hypothetical protein
LAIYTHDHRESFAISWRQSRITSGFPGLYPQIYFGRISASDLSDGLSVQGNKKQQRNHLARLARALGATTEKT